MKVTAIVFVLGLLSCCTAFKKEITQTVVIALPDTFFVATLNSNVNSPKYLNHETAQGYARYFMRGFKKEAGSTKNITLTYNENGADFILKVKSLTLSESARMEKVTDPKSNYNGQDI